MIHQFQPDFFKNLNTDIFKFKQYGAPRFRVNIPCKYKNECKYGKFSCEYSHEPFCKYSKNGRKCLNTYCTHIHELPMEFRLAQQVLYLQNQLFQQPDDPRTSKSATPAQSATSACFHYGNPIRIDLRGKTDNSSLKSTENQPKLKELCLPERSPHTETQFTAFSPMLQKSTKQARYSPETKPACTTTKPHQIFFFLKIN